MSAIDYKIKNLIPDRADECHQLYFSFAGRNMNPMQLTDDSIETLPSIAAYLDDRMVGFATSFVYAPDILEIGNIFIHPDHRNHGLGTELLVAYERRTQEIGKWNAIIAVNSDLYEGKIDKKSAETFYLKNGYNLILTTTGTRLFGKTFS